MNVTDKSQHLEHTLINSGSGGHVFALVRRYEAELRDNPELVTQIQRVFPPVPRVRQYVIRTSPENADRAIIRALARASQLCELSKVEIVNYGTDAH